MIKIVLGTRPEIIKLYPVIKSLEEQGIDYKVLFTNQHFSNFMGKDFLELFNIDTKKIISNKNLLGKSKPVMKFLQDNIEKKDKVLVQGDTRTVFEGAMVTKMIGATLYHLEAGLRTGDFNTPYPEEFYRTEVSRMADFHFAPTCGAMNNLTNEGISNDKIFVVGNTVIQSLMEITKSSLTEKEDKIVVTIHRGENKKYMSNIVNMLMKTFNSMGNYNFKVVLHPNNILKDAIRSMKLPANVELIKPLNYKNFLIELEGSKGIITDSGGVQEECCSLNIPCCVIRETTERPEAIGVGVARLFNPSVKIPHMGVVDFIKYYKNVKMIDSNNNPYYNPDCIKDIIEVMK